ncbi:DUF2147 domain-containing protein [Sphingobacterium sp. Mn56C]|uniref:DUF2147 domain-containing protein n=1 Tax=Sphingobacterium sp. Mn56C TaxID=3395261 RepID=UPI003BC6D34E
MKYYLFLCTFLCATLTAFGQSITAANGVWLNPDKDGKIEVYESSGKIYAKIIWIKSPFETDGKTPRKDRKNEDAALRDRTIQGLIVFSGFVFKDNTWVEGKIYDPKSGKTFSGKFTLNKGKLEVRGYIGTPMLGKTMVFTKA